MYLLLPRVVLVGELPHGPVIHGAGDQGGPLPVHQPPACVSLSHRDPECGPVIPGGGGALRAQPGAETLDTLPAMTRVRHHTWSAERLKVLKLKE